MFNQEGVVLYVGKAKNLKKRVNSYFQRQLDAKSLQLVKRIHSIESNLIKELKPRYNILFRDDKSYPYLLLSSTDTFARLSFYRGDKKESGSYYGPYPSSMAAREALSLLQGIFKLRQCDDVFFRNRKRPCLQYQIKRCTAPCVGYISQEAYQENVRHVKCFLEGKSQSIMHVLIERMMLASENAHYEQAASLRDQIAHLRTVQEQQIIMNTKGNVDVLGIAGDSAGGCIHVLIIREGNILGSRSYFPDTLGILINTENIQQSRLEAFITQHYLLSQIPREDMPDEWVLPVDLINTENLIALLSEKKGSKIEMSKASRGDKLKWVAMANESAKHAYALRVKTAHTQKDLSHRFVALQEILQLEALPERLECFDISHSLGEATVASCVVFAEWGPLKKDYRRFNIKAQTGGDDYAAMAEALTRRYTRLKAEGGLLPDILVIDGGKGQVGVAVSVLQELQVSGVIILGISKGPARKAGLEKLHLYVEGEIKQLPAWDAAHPAFHLIQQIRDEAHRFAIHAHRNKRAKTRLHSILEDIPGIGKQRRLALLRYFGGLQEVRKAGIEELAKVPGISARLAEQIYVALHGD
jgi:excinuclease ABC subunit C